MDPSETLMSAVESPSRWQRVAEILDHALDLPTLEREAYLLEACGSDRVLRLEVEQLLRIDTSVAEGYDRPVFDFKMGASSRNPEHIPGFDLSSKVAEGGMSTVFRGVATVDGDPRPVAVKILRRGMETDEMVRRFNREGKILAGLRHPHIVAVWGGGVLDDGRPYLVMPFIEGIPVDRFCRRLELPQRLRLFLKICDAVQYAHRSLVIHRDLKPSNILVTPDGEPRLLDFGISKLLDPVTDRPATRTRADLRMLTPAYAAPEQITGGMASTACDIYALGTLLYQLITDLRPFDGSSEDKLSEGALLALKCSRDPPRPSDRVDSSHPFGRRIRRQLCGDLDAIALQATALRPEDRYGSVAELATDLRRHLTHQPVRARPARWTYRAGKFVARHKVGVTLAVLVILGLGWGFDEREHQRAQVERAMLRSERVKTFLISLIRESDPLQGSGLDVPLRDVLASSSQRLGALAAEPEVQSELMLLLGSIYLDLAEPQLASPLLEDSWRIRTSSFGDGDPSAAESLCAMARRDLLEGQLEPARKRLENAIVVLRRASPASPRHLAYCLNELANVYQRQTDFDAAEVTYREALEVAERHHGPSTKPAITYGVNLAYLLQKRGLFNDAETLLEALIGRFDAAAAGAGMRGLVLSNLAVVRFEMGRIEGAESAFRQALGVYRLTFGPSHPKTWTALSNLSLTLRDLGRLDEARALLEERVRLIEATAGEESSALADALDGLSTIEQRLGRWAAASFHLDRSLDLRRRLYGNGHISVADSANSLGSVMLTSERPSRALELFEEALHLRQEALGEQHFKTAISLANRGRAHLDLGQLPQALADLEAASERIRTALGTGHWITALSNARWATAARLSGDLGLARALLKPAVEQLEQSPSSSPVAEQIRVESAIQSLEVGDYATAAQSLGIVLKRWVSTYGETHPGLCSTRLLLVEARIEEDPEAARLLLDEIRGKWPSIWGPTHWRQQQRLALDILAGNAEATSRPGLRDRLGKLTNTSTPRAAATMSRLLRRWPD